MNNKRDALYPGYVVPVKESSTAGAAKGGITSEENGAGDLTDEQIAAAYQKGFDDFAGPQQFRHASNYLDYHKAGLRSVRAAIAAYLARQPKAEQPVIKTWQERCDWRSDRSSTKLMVEAMKAEIADLRANFARQAQAEPAGHVVDIDRNCNESIIDVALEPGTAIYLAAPVAPAGAQNAPQAEKAGGQND